MAHGEPAEGVRVIVRLGAGHPELLGDLGRFAPRARAERMRQLATVGLALLNAAAIARATPPLEPTAVAYTEPSPSAAEDASRRERILGTLSKEF